MKLDLSKNTKNLFSNNLKECKCRFCLEEGKKHNIEFAIIVACIPKHFDTDLYCDFYCQEHFYSIDFLFDYDKKDYLIKVNLSNIDIDFIINEYNKFKKAKILE